MVKIYDYIEIVNLHHIKQLGNRAIYKYDHKDCIFMASVCAKDYNPPIGIKKLCKIIW